MRVHLEGFNDTDTIIVFECECGNTRMLDEAGDFPAERIYVYRQGVPTKNPRCCPTERTTLKRIGEGKAQCGEWYSITLHGEHSRPYMEVAHISPRPRGEILETEPIKFPTDGPDDIPST